MLRAGRGWPVEQAKNREGRPTSPHQPKSRKEVRETNEWLEARIAEAWALIRTGDHFGIGRRFLIQHGAI